jgi:hypothetical protein
VRTAVRHNTAIQNERHTPVVLPRATRAVRISGFGCCAFSCGALAAMLAGCNASTHSNQQQSGNSAPASQGALRGVGSPAVWPNYLAKDYEKPGHPTLTTRQKSTIRFALAKVEPCQRAFLRYAFPRNGDDSPFVLFFQGQASSWPHVFWTNNMYYKPADGEIFPGSGGDAPPPGQRFITWDIDHAGCVPGADFASR